MRSDTDFPKRKSWMPYVASGHAATIAVIVHVTIAALLLYGLWAWLACR